MTKKAFRKVIWDYYHTEGRIMPWRKTRDPYKILISEIMLQQTQVSRVEGYYDNFLKKFPNFETLAKATTGEVLKSWQGLGYNRRALSLKKLAEIVVWEHNGKLPRDRVVLESLPGIGKGTSGSLSAFAFNKPEIFIETNIRRVFIHFFFPRKKMVTDDEIKRYIESTMELKQAREWYWALMDYGAHLARTSKINANINSAHYKKQSQFPGSTRELRGKILRLALQEKKQITPESLLKVLNAPPERIKKVTADLLREGFIIRKGKYICINK